jgi:hypothetical protein
MSNEDYVKMAQMIFDAQKEKFEEW